MKTAYMSAPVRPLEGETIESNLARGRRWYHWLQVNVPDRIFLAPWILSCEVFDDDSPKQRAAGMQRQSGIIKRCCDEVWLVGGRMSSGMRGEYEAAVALGLATLNLTGMGEEPDHPELLTTIQAFGTVRLVFSV